MATKLNMFVTIHGEIDSEELYKELKAYHMNVTNFITRTYVYGTIDSTEPLAEYVLQICYRYGQCKVDVTPVADKKAPD